MVYKKNLNSGEHSGPWASSVRSGISADRFSVCSPIFSPNFFCNWFRCCPIKVRTGSSSKFIIFYFIIRPQNIARPFSFLFFFFFKPLFPSL